ncbi:MAG: DUF3344 domain-containing protein [Methanolinea sp.]
MRYDNPCTLSCVLLVVLILIPVASALYDEEGIAVDTIAQGVIRGTVHIDGTYGLVNPPVTHTFELAGEPAWSRIYTAVWGGTEHYSGWVECEVNGKTLDRITLYGTDDQTPGVYASSHGVYWIAFDGNNLLHKGKNAITVRTSRGEEGSKLDGRVYAVHCVALIEDTSSPLSQYWIAEGNENLHGEGWAGKNPTRKDAAEVRFTGVLDTLATNAPGSYATLTTLLLATNYGQPDYILFNGQLLGNAPADTSTYAPGSRDIGNEQSFDAEGGAGERTRYVDCERFSVTLSPGEQQVSFLRGKDLNGDGQLSTSGTPAEAEDYLHPVFVALVAPLFGAGTPVDLAVSDLSVENAYSGSTAEIIARVASYGAIPPGGADLVIESGGKTIATRHITVDLTGIQDVKIPWTPELGSHELTASVVAEGDIQANNNEIRKQVTTGNMPDLSVSIKDPLRIDAPVSGSASTPLSWIPVVFAPVGALVLIALRRGRPLQQGMLMMIVALLIAGIPLSAIPVQAAGDIQKYLIPVDVKNLGGSDAGPCTLSLFLDGEKMAVHTIKEGIPAGQTVTVKLNVATSPGTHQVRVVVDEEQKVPDKTRSNNEAQGRYAFP